MCSRSVSGEGDRRQRRDIFSTVLLPVPFLLLAGFTKPTAAVSTSLVLAIHLAWCDSFRSALSFVAVLFAGVVFTLLVGDRLTDGAMSASLIYANMNEFLPSNAPRLLTSYSANWIGPLSWLVGIGALAQKEGGPRLVGLMVVVSGGIALIGSCKVGSNVGYFIEPSWAGAVASGIVVRKLGPDRWRAGVCVALLLIALLQSVAMCSDRLIRDRIEEESWPETYRVVSRYGQLGPILTLEVGSQLLSGQKPFVPDLFIANRLATEGKLDISALVKGIADHEYVAVLAGEELWPGADGASFWNQELAVTILTHYRPVLTQRHFRVFVPRINPFVPPGGWVVEGRLGRHPMREEVRGTDPRRPELRVTRLFDETSTRVLHEIPQQGSVPHGTVRSWFPDGTLAYELVFDQGVPVGEERTWHPNGQLWTITLYANGRLEGEDRRFSPDGSPLPGVLWTDGWPSLESR